MSTRIGDFRDYTRPETRLMAQFDAKLDAMRKDLDASLAAQAALLADLAARPSLVDLGTVLITVGSTVAVTTAGAQRMVVPFAGVRPTDRLWALPDEYLPVGYGLPQVMCRNAGQLEIRIVVPTLALGTTKTIALAISAMRKA